MVLCLRSLQIGNRMPVAMRDAWQAVHFKRLLPLRRAGWLLYNRAPVA
jgi:hypothetical protein